MKQIPLANCNVLFIRKTIANNKRIDVRTRAESRSVKIIYGRDYGTCLVSLGETLIFAVCSCSIVEPKGSRPHEGIIQINIDLSPSCCDWVDTHARQLPKEGIHCLRLLERTIKDSHCIDRESLCLVNDEKVWQIQCDITCLNYDGNLNEAASIAAVACFAHFKRNDVTVSPDGDITVHSFEDRHPLNLTLLHYPFCVSFAFFEDRNADGNHHIVCDPNYIEEKISDGSLVVSANSYREIVALHCTGKSRVNHSKIILCSNMAIERVTELTKIVKEALETDKLKRLNNEPIGFASAIRLGMFETKDKPFLLKINTKILDAIPDDDIREMETDKDEPNINIYQYGRGIAGIGDGGPSTWKFDTPIVSDDQQMKHDDQRNDGVLNLGKKKIDKRIDHHSDEDSDEDIQIISETEFKKR